MPTGCIKKEKEFQQEWVEPVALVQESSRRRIVSRPALVSSPFPLFSFSFLFISYCTLTPCSGVQSYFDNATLRSSLICRTSKFKNAHVHDGCGNRVLPTNQFRTLSSLSASCCSDQDTYAATDTNANEVCRMNVYRN